MEEVDGSNPSRSTIPRFVALPLLWNWYYATRYSAVDRTAAFMPQDNLPQPYSQMSWGELVANLTEELTKAKFQAEGDANQLQQLYPGSPKALITAQADYTEAAASNNAISAYVQALLRSGKAPHAQLPDLDEARQRFAVFENDVAALRDRSNDIRGFVEGDTGLIPSLLDVTKVFDVILKAIEWFKSRQDKQREEVADLLQTVMWRQWAHVGDALPPSVGSVPSAGPQTKTKTQTGS